MLENLVALRANNVLIQGDSTMVINQLTREYNVLVLIRLNILLELLLC